MNHSDTFAEIATALASAQGEYTEARKDGYNPHFDSDFASLASVVKASRPALTKYGICVVQDLGGQDGRVTLSTRLIHSSGEWFESLISASVSGKNPVQAIGAAATYLRRYGYSAITGVVVEGDDLDGEGVDDGEAPAPAPEPSPSVDAPHDWTDTERRRFFARLHETLAGVDIGDLDQYEAVKVWTSSLGRPKPSQMPEDKRTALLDFLSTEKGLASFLNALDAHKATP